MTGKELARMMRVNRVTIKEASRRLGVTMKRVRERRVIGLDHPDLVRDWVQAITGADPGPLMVQGPAPKRRPARYPVTRQGRTAMVTIPE